MLGRSVGLSEEKIRHIGDEEPPEDVYAPAERAIVCYARTSTLPIAVDDDTYGALDKHYSREQILELWAVVGVANIINRFHATFHTDVDEKTLDVVEAGNRVPGACPVKLNAAPSST